MPLKPKKSHSWDIRSLDPLKLSDAQAEYYYAKARREMHDIPDFPPGSTGRFTQASLYVRHVQTEMRKHTTKKAPEF